MSEMEEDVKELINNFEDLKIDKTTYRINIREIDPSWMYIYSKTLI